jgi:hypothetical protein
VSQHLAQKLGSQRKAMPLACAAKQATEGVTRAARVRKIVQNRYGRAKVNPPITTLGAQHETQPHWLV